MNPFLDKHQGNKTRKARCCSYTCVKRHGIRKELSVKLFPQEILRSRQRYNIGIKLAALQAVIFLFLMLFVAAVDASIRHRENQSMYLNMQLQDIRFLESEEVALLLREYRANEVSQAQVAYWLELPHFNTDRLNMVQETLPFGVQLLSVDIDEGGAFLTVQARNLSLADIHREAWISTGLVDRVQLDSATSNTDGTVQYRLSLRWCHEG